jgi:hypothetical protein
MGGSTGEVVPKIAWQSEETTIAGFDVKVRQDEDLRSKVDVE